MWIKICANTNLEDALLAAEMGADAVGFVFASSPRQVTPAQAAAIVAPLPKTLETVGVFSGWPTNRIIEAVEQVKLTTIQLHGARDAALANTLSAYFAGKVAIIQVLHWNIDARREQAGEIERQIDRLTATSERDRILIDSKAGSTKGGTGIAFPWREAQAIFSAHPKIILAGGLDANNVGKAIHRLNPWGVDVASGVESSPGKKDENKVQDFILSARGADRPSRN